MSYFNTFYEYINTHASALLLFKVVVIFMIVIVINFIIKQFLNRLTKHLQKTNFYLGVLYQSAIKPFQVLVFFIGMIYICQYTFSYFGILKNYSYFINVELYKIAFVITFFNIFLQFKKHAKAKVIANNTRTDGGYNDFSKIEALFKLSEVIAVIILLVVMLSLFKIPLTGILTIGGVGAAALAYANQQLISNIFSGFILYFDRPFSVGDWIYTIDGKTQGTVVHIGLRLTKLVGFDKRPIFIPNNIFNTTVMVNASRMSNRRILQYIGIRHEDFDNLEFIMKDIRAMLASHIEIDQSLLTLINVVNGSTDMGDKTEGVFGASSINFQVYTFTKTTNWVKFQNIQDDIMIKIGKIIASHKAKIAFSSTSLYVENDINVNHKNNI